jgi:LysM repeat protein
VGGTGITGGISAPAAGTSPAVTGGVAAPAPKYTVKHGDTLSGIAASHGMSVGQLQSLNPQIKNPDMIFPGQSVNLGKGRPVGSGGSSDGGGSFGIGDGIGGKGVITGDPVSVGNALDGARNHGGGGHVPDGTPVITAPVANELGGGGNFGGAPDFPTTSTYPPVDQSLSQNQGGEAAAGRFRNLGRKIKGWGFGKPPADPAQNAVYVDVPRNTNPLDIKDGHGPHGGPHGPQGV